MSGYVGSVLPRYRHKWADVAALAHAKSVCPFAEIFAVDVDPHAPDERIRFAFDLYLEAAANEKTLIVDDAIVRPEPNVTRAFVCGHQVNEERFVRAEGGNTFVDFTA